MVENDNKSNTGEIIIYQTKDGKTRIDVRFEDETVWLTQAQLVELNFIEGMKIIPLQIDDLKMILENNISYDKLYQIFEKSFNSDLAPKEWRNICIVKKLNQKKIKLKTTR